MSSVFLRRFRRKEVEVVAAMAGEKVRHVCRTHDEYYVPGITRCPKCRIMNISRAACLGSAAVMLLAGYVLAFPEMPTFLRVMAPLSVVATVSGIVWGNYA